MIESYVSMQELYRKKLTAQERVAEKKKRLEDYMVVQSNTLLRYAEDIEKNDADLEKMQKQVEVADGVMPRLMEVQGELQRLIREDTWEYGDPEEDKLENNAEYREVMAEFKKLNAVVEGARDMANKIFYRR